MTTVVSRRKPMEGLGFTITMRFSTCPLVSRCETETRVSVSFPKNRNANPSPACRLRGTAPERSSRAPVHLPDLSHPLTPGLSIPSVNWSSCESAVSLSIGLSRPFLCFSVNWSCESLFLCQLRCSSLLSEGLKRRNRVSVDRFCCCHTLCLCRFPLSLLQLQILAEH